MMMFVAKLDNTGASFVAQAKALKRPYSLNFSTLFYLLFRHQKGVEKVDNGKAKNRFNRI